MCAKNFNLIINKGVDLQTDAAYNYSYIIFSLSHNRT